jgi:hypothetical protein
MAIKGKGKTRGRKSVAPAPKPVLVTRKPPVWRRRWVIFSLIAVLVIGTGYAIYAVMHASSQRSFRTQQREAVSGFSERVTSNVPPRAASAGGSTLFLFPDATTELSDLASGKTKPADSLATAKGWAADAAKSAAAIQAIPTSQLIAADLTAGDSAAHAAGLTRAALTNAQFLMVQGLQTYGHAFAVWETAAGPDVTAATRKSLTTQATDLANTASTLFSRGWTQFVEVRHQVGLPSLGNFSPPQPSPSASASASPKASSSASPTG